MSSMIPAGLSRYIRSAVTAALLASLAACASLNVKQSYSPPQEAPIASSVTVAKPFEKVWESFVRNLSQSFFVVNNISKESRLINISVSGNRVKDYTDCGRLNYKINSKDWSFRPDEDSLFDEPEWRSRTYVHHEVSNYGGRMNIFVAPKCPDTVFEINTSYTLKMRDVGRQEVRNVYNQVVSEERYGPIETTFQFTTKAPEERRFGTVTIKCQASGAWEQLILDMARAS